jgi:hypothetical protein
VTHSLGSLIGLHLRRALGARVTGMTLVDPVVVSVLRECGENAAYAEMEAQYQRFKSLSADHEAAAHFFVDHWSGSGAWDSMGERGRTMVTSLVPKLRLEMTATRSDTRKLAWLAESPPPTTILVGEKTLLAPRAVARQLGPALQLVAHGKPSDVIELHTISEPALDQEDVLVSMEAAPINPSDFLLVRGIVAQRHAEGDLRGDRAKGRGHPLGSRNARSPSARIATLATAASQVVARLMTAAPRA